MNPASHMRKLRLGKIRRLLGVESHRASVNWSWSPNKAQGLPSFPFRSPAQLGKERISRGIHRDAAQKSNTG
jgi:hypothetical protein